MTKLQDYDKWDRIVADLSDSEPENEGSKLLQRIKQKAATATTQRQRQKSQTTATERIKKRNEYNDQCTPVNPHKYAQSMQQMKKKQTKSGPKPVRIVYDALNIPSHGLKSMFMSPFSPTCRLLINSIHPNVACGNLIHYYYECSLALFILFYIINPFIFFRLTFFYNSNFILNAYYFHLFYFIFHGYIDIALCLFDSRIKNVNSIKIKQMRWTYVCYLILMLALCSMLFHILSLDGPQLTFNEYRKIVFFRDDKTAYDKIDAFVGSDAGNLYHGIVYVLMLTFVIDTVFVGWFIFNVASFKRFKKENAMICVARYCASFVQRLVIEIVIGVAIVLIFKNKKDTSVWDISYGLLYPNRAVFILPVLIVLYCIVTGINHKMQNCFLRMRKRFESKST